MNDFSKIILGLGFFLVVVTGPFWFAYLTESRTEPPELKMPVGETRCIESREYMRSFHMDLLNEWRDEVVREGNRVYVSNDGQEFRMSLSGTCLSCHESRSDFCDRCHNYLSVSAYCWDCHHEGRPVSLEGK